MPAEGSRGKRGWECGAWGINWGGGWWEKRRVARPLVESFERGRRTRTDISGGSCGQEGVMGVYLQEFFSGG